MKTPIRMFRIAGIAAIAGLSIGGLLSNSSIPAPTGYTGSPADGKTCGTQVCLLADFYQTQVFPHPRVTQVLLQMEKLVERMEGVTVEEPQLTTT